MKKQLLLIILFLIPRFTYAQADIEQATRETDRIGRKEVIEEALNSVPQEYAIPEFQKAQPKRGEQKFFIKKINLVGLESISAEELLGLLAEYENRELTLTDLNNLGNQIEREYLSRGIISMAFVPAQEIKDATVNLQVVEARMGELKIQKPKYFNPERLYYYWKLPMGEVLRYDRMSEYLQMMGRNPDREVKATLVAGEKPGFTDVVLTSQNNYPVHVTTTFDNEGSVSTGKSRINIGYRDNNFLGRDDMFLSNYVFGNYFSGVYAYHSVPLNYSGTTLLYGSSRSRSNPKKQYTPFSFKSEAESTRVSLSQELNDKGKYKGEVSFGFEAKDKSTRNNEGTYNRDRLRVFSLGSDIILRESKATTQLSAEVSQGVNAFGATTRANPFASRGAKSRFTKLNLGIQQGRLLPYGLKANLKFKSQIASKLTPQEEFGLGGINSVRGYPPDDYLADHAVLTSAELLIPSFLIPQRLRLPYSEDSLREQITTVAFIDYGWGKRRNALATERESTDYLGVGAGFRVKLYNQALLRLEWGFPVADKPINEEGHSRFHFSVDFQDLFPEEFVRIANMIEEENIKQLAWDLVNAEFSRTQSPIAVKLYSCLTQAKLANKERRFQDAKELYLKIVQISKSLYRQAEDYVRACYERQEELKNYRRLAWISYKEGHFFYAKELWQKVIDEAKFQPLLFSY